MSSNSQACSREIPISCSPVLNHPLGVFGYLMEQAGNLVGKEIDAPTQNRKYLHSEDEFFSPIVMDGMIFLQHEDFTSYVQASPETRGSLIPNYFRINATTGYIDRIISGNRLAHLTFNRIGNLHFYRKIQKDLIESISISYHYNDSDSTLSIEKVFHVFKISGITYSYIEENNSFRAASTTTPSLQGNTATYLESNYDVFIKQMIRLHRLKFIH